MKKLVGIILGLLVVVVVVACAGVGYLFLRYPIAQPPSAIKVEATPERVARGEYLAVNISGCRRT